MQVYWPFQTITISFSSEFIILLCGERVFRIGRWRAIILKIYHTYIFKIFSDPLLCFVERLSFLKNQKTTLQKESWLRNCLYVCVFTLCMFESLLDKVLHVIQSFCLCARVDCTCSNHAPTYMFSSDFSLDNELYYLCSHSSHINNNYFNFLKI